MSSAPTIQTPIAGREAAGESGEPVAALSEFYRAFNGRDLALMAENWDHADDVAMDNPLGGITRGWPAIRAVYERIFHSPARVQVEFHDYTHHVIGDVFYAVGRERGASPHPASRSISPSARARYFAASAAVGAKFTITARSTTRSS